MPLCIIIYLYIHDILPLIFITVVILLNGIENHYHHIQYSYIAQIYVNIYIYIYIVLNIYICVCVHKLIHIWLIILAFLNNLRIYMHIPILLVGGLEHVFYSIYWE